MIEIIDNQIKVTSLTLVSDKAKDILATPGIYFPDGHFQYPVTLGSRIGNHLDALFILEPVLKHQDMLNWIVEDICLWYEQEKISANTIFAPAQKSVVQLTSILASKLGLQKAYWEYLPEGWFGSSLVEGQIDKDSQVLVFNDVSQQGRCVGQRLPEFVKNLGGQVVAAGVVAKGTANGVTEAEKLYGSKLYSMFQVPIKIYPPDNCDICKTDNKPLVPWTKMILP